LTRTRPQLIRSLGERIAAIGRVPLLGTVAYAQDAPVAGASRRNSAQRLRALHSALTVPHELAQVLARTPGPVLLVDDFTDTGWTLTVTAGLLHRAGAEGAFPLVPVIQG
jgi:ATP-dependent DNA helicase RecQ